MKAAHLILAGALALPALANAAEFYNGRHTLLCTIHEINECNIADECVEQSLENLDAPRYFLVDFDAERLVTTELSEIARESPINSVTMLGEKLFLQGSAEASETSPSSVAWSLSVADPEGTMAFSLVRDDAIIAAFGACVPID